MKNPLRRNNADQYPQYYRTRKGVYAKVTGPDSFIKAFWTVDKEGKPEYGTEKVSLTNHKAADIFKPPMWSRTNKKQWEKHLEPIASADRGVRGAKSIEFVFEHEGERYYRYKDLQDYPVGRMKEFEAVIMQLNFMMDGEAIDTFFTQLIDLSSGKDGNIDVGRIAAIVREADNRRKLGVNPQIWRSIGTVLFFTEDEDTSRVDFAGMQAKLKSWESLDDNFFLKTPLRDYLPSVPQSTNDLTDYLLRAKIRNAILTETLEGLYKKPSKASGGN